MSSGESGSGRVSPAVFQAMVNLRDALEQDGAAVEELMIYGNLPSHLEDAISELAPDDGEEAAAEGTDSL